MLQNKNKLPKGYKNNQYKINIWVKVPKTYIRVSRLLRAYYQEVAGFILKHHDIDPKILVAAIYPKSSIFYAG